MQVIPLCIIELKADILITNTSHSSITFQATSSYGYETITAIEDSTGDPYNLVYTGNLGGFPTGKYELYISPFVGYLYKSDSDSGALIG